MTMEKSKLSVLELVYPPISNQEAVWFAEVPEVAELLQQSDFYMIAGRPEVKFTNMSVDSDAHIIRFGAVCGTSLVDYGEIQVHELPTLAQNGDNPYWIEGGDKFIRLRAGTGDQDSDVLDWFTTEKLLWERSRGRTGIHGFDRFREFMTYDLLYVGIAKKGDSFQRLIAKGHKARQTILANEPQRYPGARVTDEIYLFMFKVEPLIIQQFELEHEFTDEDLSPSYDPKQIVIDAEKAFVSLLQPSYNVTKYANYPQSTDGLYGAGYVRYGYTVGENVKFNTAHGQIKGAYDPKTGMFTNGADCIFVEGDIVRLFVAGVDWPDTPAFSAG